MSDPWSAFARESEGREVAGYFESAGRRAGAPGQSVSFTSANELLTQRNRDAPENLRTSVDAFVRRGRDRWAVGYLGFDAVGLFEPALRMHPAGDPFPLGAFALIEHPRRATVPPRPARRAVEFGPVGRPFADSLPWPKFGTSIGRLIEEIRNGEAYQVVLAHRRTWPRPDDLVARAGLLRATERFAFFYYLRFGDLEIVGATPESVAEVDGRRAAINPIAGTIPRGAARGHRRALRVDPKELAEHRMLVDLARNDLGGVAIPGTVRLRSRERLERFARLSHLVTRVEAHLPRGVGPWDVLAASFPAGTVAGAPKIRATQLLRREERTWRGVYGGTVGLVGPGPTARWALAIRTGFAAGRRLHTAAGAGVVQHSAPRREYDETLVKLAHVEAALVGGPA